MLHNFNNDSTYRARIQLAVSDHNIPVDRNAKQQKQTHEYQYHRRYGKQTKNWDVVKILQTSQT